MSQTGSLPQGKGLAFKLSLLILSCTSAIFLASFLYYHTSSKTTLMQEARADAANLTLASIRKIEGTLASVEAIPGLLAFSYGKNKPTASAISTDLLGFILFNSAVYGSCVAYEPYAFDRDVEFFAPYAYMPGGRPMFTYLSADYNYPQADWFLIPKEIRRPIWSEPYFDEGGGNVVMSTYSIPFFREEDGRKRFLGVVTADISLEWLRTFIKSISIYQSGYAFLLSRNGVFLSHPNDQFIMRESIFSLAETHSSKVLRDIGKKMVQGETGFVRLPEFVMGEPAWLSYAPVSNSDWSMGLVIPEAEMFQGLEGLSREVAVIGFIGFVLLLIVVIVVSTSITKPLKTLAERTAEIAKGNLDIPVPKASTGDEVGQLARSFEGMRLALREYIANLTETTKAKERMESELKIARSIQMSFLPKRFPPFPDIEQFELFATLEPALEVGGDLFDFFLLDDGRLLFLVGDVSGKGVPAALFMAVTKTLIKGIAELENSPAEILARVNRELLVDNEALLFVTMFLGILDYKTGELAYSNAGHNPPVLLRSGHNAEWLTVPKALFLGVMEESVYKNASIKLEKDDKLIVYTDGVNEAENQSGAFYSNPRLLDTATNLSSEGAKGICTHLVATVHEFAGGAPQTDDITVLTLHFRGK
ncbi:SpoIIE family protein phosphatase [Desulfovibrio inopinatus]|uniref:SpoIIE family protein phosphatase n=1 Tax=Desulfovibrio inopinatus TaxID=102109 RepID=UPI000418645B|nr:SpoIIE family protein phosphatase [Desulfovibrio inopinatus]